MPAPDTSPDDIAALRAALAAEQLARREAEARASGAEAMVAHLKLLIAQLKRDKYGASSERGRKLIDQLELELGELVAAASEDATKAEDAAAKDGPAAALTSRARSQPVRAPLPAHLPRERVVMPRPTACPCCGGKLSKLGEDITETLGGRAEASGRSSRPCARSSPAAPARPSPSRRRRSTRSPAAGPGRTCWP